MVKATLKSAVLLFLVAAGMVATSVPSFAETQNVKVGGDITTRAFHRENLDLHDNDGALDGEDDFLMSTVGINVGADLTENVSTFIRLANERDWNNTSNATGNETSDFDLSQAYVTLKELFYSPLTVTIGQQPIRWGRGFVLGSNLLPGTVLGAGDRNAAIAANEFTDFTAFDAIRASVDLSGAAAISLPVTLDYVYIKLDENTIGLPDDVNIQGVNVGTRFDDMGNSEVEMYFLNKRDKNTVIAGGPATDNNGSVSTVGLRGSAQPMDGLNVYGELAYQFGKRTSDLSGVLAAGDSQQAWAANLGADYTFADVTTTPKLGAEWILWTGKDVDGAVQGWDPIARGYFTTAIREFQTGTGVGGFYAADQTCLANGAAGTSCTGGYSNQHQLSLYGGFKPIEDLNVDQRYSWFILEDGAIPVAGAKRESYAGFEWDTVATYNYTEDVQFGVIYALFAPGGIYRNPTDSAAQELISSVSVKF